MRAHTRKKESVLMKVVIQVVDNASVSVNGELISNIDNGYLLLVGIDQFDDEEIVSKIAQKTFLSSYIPPNNELPWFIRFLWRIIRISHAKGEELCQIH